MSRQKDTALITGASAGIGLAYAELLAARNHDLVLVARREDRLQALASKLEAAHGIRATVLSFDLADPSSPPRLFRALEEASIDVDMLINNAGFGTVGTVDGSSLKSDLDMIQVNVVSLVQLTHLLLPGMRMRGKGHILNIGSIAGFQPGPFMATYCATKAFVNHWTEALSFELKGTGVTATVSCPGATRSEFAALAGNDTSLLFRLGSMSSRAVADQGLRATLSGRPRVVHGLSNRFAVGVQRLVPRAAVVWAASLMNQAP